MTTLTQLLKISGSRFAETGPSRLNNDCINDLLDRFDDCPEGLIDFQRSDWVNLCECYTYDLLNRWNQQERSIMALWDEYCEAIGATSTIHALEGECDSFEDGDDMNAAIVNHAMTWGASEILRDIAQYADEHPELGGQLWESFRRAS